MIAIKLWYSSIFNDNICVNCLSTDPAMNSTQRITMLKKKIQDLRKTYNMIKTELASIDRRRKKLRRREREMKKNVQKQLQQQQQNQQILIQVDENHPTIM